MKPSKVYCFILVTALSLGLIGCATKPPAVNTEFDSQADFAANETFVILPLPKNIPGADPGLTMRLSSTVENTVRTAMIAKGYREAPKDEADIAVFIHGKIVPKTDVTDWGFTPTYGAYGWNRGYRGYYGSMGMYGGSNVTVDQYNEGTLIGEVYDVETQSMIWVGWMTGRANQGSEGETARAAAAVDRILALFPAMGAQPIGDAMAN
jgi:hypothetical protein